MRSDEADDAGGVRDFEKLTIRELQKGARSPQGIANRFNMEYRKDAVLDGDEEKKIHADEAETILDGMVADGILVRLDDPDGWYQLADWDDRPLRVLSVSHHGTEIDGAAQIEIVWLDESIRAARHEHGIEKDCLDGMAADDERQLYHIHTAHYDVLEQYRETLQRLASDLHRSHTAKATVYERLAEATDIEDQHEVREREVGLRV